MGDSAFAWSSDIDGDLGTGASLSTAELTTGQHVITLEVTDSDLMSTQVQRTITVAQEDALEATNLEASPFAVDVVAAFGDGLMPYTVTVRSSSDTDIDWTAAETIPWLTLDTASGHTPSELVLTIDPSQQSVGTHYGTISFSSDEAGNSPLDLVVMLQVTGNALYWPRIVR